MKAFFEGLVIVVAVVVYFLPAIVADARERSDAFAVTIFNVLFGWTVIGWVAAFVWARHRVSEKRLSSVAQTARRAMGRVTIAKIVARSRRARATRRRTTASV